MTFDSILKVIRGIVKLKGGTDGTLIGNDGDRLKIDAIVSSANVETVTHSSYYPNPRDYKDGLLSLQSEVGGALRIRGPVHTDESSFRDDFVGSALYTTLTGTVSFTNSSTIITGSGTSFLTELKSVDYIKKSADTDSLYVQIDSIVSDTEIVLSTPYTGITGSTTAVTSRWVPAISTNGSYSVTGSIGTLTSGTTIGTISIRRLADYLPFSLDISCSISQRIANQTTTIGFTDILGGTPNNSAVIIFDDTDSTKVKFRTRASSASIDSETTTVTLPNSGVSSSKHLYTIDVSNRHCALSIDGTTVAKHFGHIPDPYITLYIGGIIQNTAVVTSTTLDIDNITFENVDRVSVKNNYTSSPIKSQLVSKSASTGLYRDAISDDAGALVITSVDAFGAGFVYGKVGTAATTQVKVESTTYTDQTTNVRGSIRSANANDTSAGTGARTVKITYYDQNYLGPYTETIILNGTSWVNTASASICHIEKMEVITAGSGGVNSGIITLNNAIGGGGSAIGTIAASENQTFWAHHFIPFGKVVGISSFSVGHNGTVVGSGAMFNIYFKSATTNTIELQVSDFFRLYGQSSSITREYSAPIKLTGPGQVVVKVTPESSGTLVFYSSVSYYEMLG